MRKTIKNQNDNIKIDSYLEAIDNKDISKIKNLNISKNNKKDVILELYNKECLTVERLQFIVEHCCEDLGVSTFLIKRLLQDNNVELLDVIFNQFYFFDIEYIKYLLNNYTNKIPISTSSLKEQIKKYKISTELEDDDTDNVDKYLINACKKGNENIVKYLVKLGGNTNKKRWHGRTPFFIACENGHVNIVKYFIEHGGADINEKFMWQYSMGEEIYFGTPLIIACRKKNDNYDMVKFLVEKGADINKKDGFGETPLFAACNITNANENNEKIVKYLIDHGADVNKEGMFKKTPLYVACESRNVNIVKYLIEHGADVNKENRDGETPLFAACNYRDEDIVKYLIAHGANVNKINKAGESPLSAACHNKYTKNINKNIIKYLIEHGANVNKETKNIIMELKI